MSTIVSSAEVRNLDKISLYRFLEMRLPEGAQIDYKENLSRDSADKAHREFLKDITAFANAHGGLLILGVKEPSDASSPQTQIVGIEDGDKLAQTLERIAASCVDPRIPGLLVKPVQLDGNKYVIVVHVPPSLVRPHMVTHQKHRTFYIRHSESSVPMSTHEIRDTVLSSATTEGRARAYAQEEEVEALEYIIGEGPAFLLQAIPLLSLESPWDVLSRPIENVMRGDSRLDKYEYNHFNLASGLRPEPTLKGILECCSREEKIWLTEAHRSGFVQAVYSDVERISNEQGKFILHEGYIDLFRAFCDLCDELWRVTETDIPYLFRCRFINAGEVAFFTGEVSRRKLTKPFGRRLINLPERLRQTGDSIGQLPAVWGERLFNAFGLKKVPQPE